MHAVAITVGSDGAGNMGAVHFVADTGLYIGPRRIRSRMFCGTFALNPT